MRIMSCVALVSALCAFSCGGEAPEEEIAKIESSAIDFEHLWPTDCDENCQLNLRLDEEIKTVVPIVPLSGNVSTRRVHQPGCAHYLCMDCTVSFKTLRSALEAGFRPHDECFE